MILQFCYFTKQMGGGCLAPKPLQGDLSIQLIDQLHQSIPSISPQQKYLQESSSYAADKQKLFKKGPLRKLIDYLSSHRHKICDSLAHNLKICIQKGQNTTWKTGLIIMERVVMMGGQGTSNASIDKLQNILRNKGQNSSFVESERMKTDVRSLKTESEKQNRSGYYSIHESPIETIMNQISSARFQSIMFDTVSACLEDQALYIEALRILCDYINIKPKKLQNQDKVLILLTTLMENLKIDFQSIITLQTYYRLLSKLKDKVVLSISSNLKAMIKMWIQFKQLIECSKSIELINKYESKISTLQLIIARFLTSSLNGMQYKTMIYLLLQVQDQNSFGLSDQFQGLYVYILSNSELGEHLMKALFLEYLRYGVMGNFSAVLYKDIIESSQELLSSHNQVTYKNIKNKQTRQNLFELIRRWLVVKKYVALQDIIKYHSSLLIFCFLEGFSSDFRAICMDIIIKIANQQKVTLVQTIFDIYQRAQTFPKIRHLLYQFHKILSDQLRQITLMANNSRFAIDISALTTTQTIQMLSSLMILYGKFDKQTTFLYMQQICQLLGSVLQFLGDEKQGNKNQLLNNLSTFLNKIISIQGIVIAFYQKLLRIIDYKEQKQTQCPELKIISSEIQKIFDRNMIRNYRENQTCFHQRSDQAHSQTQLHSFGFQKCKSYFRDMATTETRSRFYSNDNNFQKVPSVLQDEQQLKQQQSMRDIMDMINS